MAQERYRLLAAVIAEHPERQVVGRTRLQKTIKLLQRLGLPTDYSYMLYFYGPYSEGLQAEIGMLEHFGLVTESQKLTQDERPYYRLTASADARLDDLAPFRGPIALMATAAPVVLELAATYDAFREQDLDHDTAIKMLREKKGEKCHGGNEREALLLLSKLGLSAQ
jgi:uncharacterized protein YwgA